MFKIFFFSNRLLNIDLLFVNICFFRSITCLAVPSMWPHPTPRDH